MGDKKSQKERGRKVMSSKDIVARREKDAKRKRAKRAQNQELNCNKVRKSSIPIEEEDSEENMNVDMTLDNAPFNEALNSMTMEMNASIYLNLYILL